MKIKSFKDILVESNGVVQLSLDDIEKMVGEFKFAQKDSNLKYKFIKNIETFEDINNMKEFSYGKFSGNSEVEYKTRTSDGLDETVHIYKNGDIIISGPNKEKYKMNEEKLFKKYEGSLGKIITPKTDDKRLVAVFNGLKDGSVGEFVPSYGGKTKVMYGDYIVKEDDGYYRVAKDEFKKTYKFL